MNDNNFNFYSFPKKIEKNINWEDLYQCEILNETGPLKEKGVFICKFKNNESLILKTSKDLANIHFTYLLTKQTKIKTPAIRIIEFSDKEYISIFINLERLALENNNNKLILYVKTMLNNSPFLVLIEYIPSFTLKELNSKVGFLFDEANENSRKNFIELGRILAFNILNNNQNEFSEHDYFTNVKPKNLNFLNFENILLQVDLDKLIPNTNFKKDFNKLISRQGNINNNDNFNNYNYNNNKDSNLIENNLYLINSKCFCLDANNKDNLENISVYLNDLNGLLTAVFSDLKILLKKGFGNGSKIDLEDDKNNILTKGLHDNKFVNNLRIAFIENLNFKLGNRNVLHLLMGIVILIEDICNINLIDIQKIYEFVFMKSIRKDTEEKYFAENMKKLSLDYFKYLINFSKQTKEKNSEVFEWVANVSLGFYSIKFSHGLEETLKAQESLLIDLMPESKVNELIKDNNNKTNNNKNIDNKNHLQEFNKINLNNSNVNNKNLIAVEDKKDLQQRNFFTDVHNGVYEYLDLTKDMVMEKIKNDS